jgi:hypothetical protein
MFRRQVLAIVLPALLAVTAGPAQTIKVRTLALLPDKLPEVSLKVPDGFQPLVFSDVQPGELVTAVSANPLPLYKKTTDAEGKEAFTVAESIKIPGNAKGILLLAWTSGDKVRYLAIDDNFSEARFNDWLLINTGTRPVAFKVGDGSKPFLIPPGTATTQRISAPKGEGATVLAQAPFDGKAKTFFSTYWPVYGDKRALVLFFDDGSKIRVKRISDKIIAEGS